MRLLKEDEVAFHLAQDDGRTVVVPKRGLHREVQDHIRTIEKAENFCHGGRVKGYADGGAVDPSLVLTGDPQTDALIQGSSVPPVADPNPTMTLQGAGTEPIEINRATGIPTDAPGVRHGIEQAPPMPVAPPVQQSNLGPSSNPQQLPDLSALNPAGAPLAYAKNTVVPEQKEAARAQADVEARTAKAQTDAKQAEQDFIQSGAKAREDYLTSRMAEYRKVRDDFMADKVNPRHLWESKSTGDKAMALVGIVLGGMGAGLTGGPNQALGVVQKLIEQDIDAQKSNIGKKATLLSMHLQETRDMGQAMRETMIDKLGAFRAQFEKAATQFGGDRAQANAKAALAQIDAGLLPLIQQSAQWTSQMAMMKWQMQAYQQWGQQGQGQGYTPGGSPPTMPKSLMDPGARAEAMQRDSERRIDLGNGRWTLAHDPAAATKAREVLAGTEGARATLDTLRRHLSEAGRGSGAQLSTLTRALATDMARAQGEGGSSEAVKQWEAQIPGFWSGKWQGSKGLDALGEVIEMNQRRMLSQYAGGQFANRIREH